MRTGKPRERIQENYDVLFVFNKAFCLFHHHSGHLHVP